MAALTREQLESYIASLDAALARGVRSVTIGGQTVTYNSAESLRSLRDSYQRQLNGLNGTGRSRVGYLTYGGRGY